MNKEYPGAPQGAQVAVMVGGIVFAMAIGAFLLGASRAKAAQPQANLYGKVTDTVTGGPLPGVLVTLDGLTAYSDGNGDYTFPNIQPGSYNATFSKEEYQPEVKMITLNQGNNELDVGLIPVAVAVPVANLYGTVIDSATGYALPGVKVTIDGAVTYTDSNGFYSFTGLTPGSYTISFAKDGYTTLVR